MNRSSLTGISVFLTLLPVALPLAAETAIGSPGFHYSEGWAVVSAPPPPGPYHAVNLDPRIPGQDVLPLLPLPENVETTLKSETPSEDIPAEALQNPPAAGKPVFTVDDEQSPAADLGANSDVLPPPVPGSYSRMMPAYNFRTAPGYPGRSGYSGNRSMPPMGYYGSPVNRYPEQQVPPPPVYDAMMNKRRSHVGYGPEGAP